MRSKLSAGSVLAFTILCLGPAAPGPAQPAIHTLSNGLRVVVVHFPKSTNVSIFSFLPMGLCSDPPGQAQWSHLIEHLVLRSTFPNDLKRANAETLPDHMRLDFYGSTADWKEGMSHHRRWLEGASFTSDTLAAEKPKVVSECDFTTRNFATHKFALAAWSHAARHSNAHVAIKADVLRAGLQDVQRYHHEHFFLPQQTTVCAVGGVDAQSFLAEAGRQLGNIASRARPVPRATLRSGNLDITWDLDARHLLLVWPLPESAAADFASLMTAGQWLTMQYFSDAQLKRLTGPTLAGADLATPEGNCFYISASLRPGATFADVEKILRAPLQKLSDDKVDLPQLPMLGRQLASSLTNVPDSASILRQIPPGMNPAMVEGNIGLAFAMNVHRYGPHREIIARNLATASSASIHSATAKHLAPAKGVICSIKPQSR